eukprot:GHVS01098078.1.p1 GENE.GHVS01098078.1~~GHVS01098078.1.p1  ORF type:complete len:687 (-),score=148.73 GHVS01098078.1:542-2602(-)
MRRLTNNNDSDGLLTTTSTVVPPYSSHLSSRHLLPSDDSLTSARPVTTSSGSVELSSRYLSGLQMEVTTVPEGIEDFELVEVAKGLNCVEAVYRDMNKYSEDQLKHNEEEQKEEEQFIETTTTTTSRRQTTGQQTTAGGNDQFGNSYSPSIQTRSRLLRENVSPHSIKTDAFIKAVEEGLPPGCPSKPCPPPPTNGGAHSNNNNSSLASLVSSTFFPDLGTGKRLSLEGRVGVRDARRQEEAAGPALRVGGGASSSTSSGVPNDDQFSLQWSVHTDEPMSCQAERAWEWWTGETSPLTVAVIDSGCDLSHPDLKGRLWQNPGEICGDGLDNDGNGFVDDCHGYDFANDDADPSPAKSGHGTGAAGIIAAESNNSRGIAGVCWGCKIMCIKFIGNGQGKVSDQVQAIDYAVRMGAKISNNSYGGYGHSALERSAIERAQVAGHLFVCSAGNHSLNTDLPKNNHTPSAYNLDNIVAVGAADQRGDKARFSNYGKKTVDVVAPGVRIRTVERAEGYATVSGTSFASPAVAGVAGLIWSAYPSLSFVQVKQSLVDGCLTALSDPSVANLSVCGGRVNAYRSLYVAALMSRGQYPGHDVLAANGGLRPVAAQAARSASPTATGVASSAAVSNRSSSRGADSNPFRRIIASSFRNPFVALVTAPSTTTTTERAQTDAALNFGSQLLKSFIGG